MTKKLLAMLLVLAIALCVASCGKGGEAGDESTTKASGEETELPLAESGVVSTVAADLQLTGDPSKVKIGVILLHDENVGYDFAHMQGIKTAAKNLGIDDDHIIWKYNIGEDQACEDAAIDLVEQGCKYIFSDSYGHQSYMQKAATDHPDVHFVSMTGDTAAKSGLDNFSNAFTNVYESRYVAGVVAGMKVAELAEANALTDANFDENGNVRIGYVGAFPYAEVVSGYTAFYLGVKSVYEKVVMEVIYTSSWADLTAEGTAAESLIADGCVIIGQHADTTGAPSAIEAAYKSGKTVFSVGYNVSMLNAAPNAALTSASNNWGVYYEYALKCAINGDKIATNWVAGYAKGAVAITELGKSCAAGTAEKVAEVEAAISDGTLKVFDTSKFTVGGEKVVKAFATDTDGDWTPDADNVVADGYFHESYVQSAPCFGLRIDGITEKA